MSVTVNNPLFRRPIITSAMDTDAYKLHMQQVVFEKYASVLVKYKFRCRSDEGLAKYVAEIRDAIFALEGLSFTPQQLTYLSEIPFLKPAFIDFLRQFRFDPQRYLSIRVEQGQLVIDSEGPWLYTILFEIPVLAIVSEVRNRHRYGEADEDQIQRVLCQKVEHLQGELRRRGMQEFQFADFGTRRRFSYPVQRRVVEYLAQTLPDHFIGTSNYHLAQKYQLTAIGTMAHEYLQAHQAFVNVADSQKEALEVWNQVYRGRLGVALTDCITTDAFLQDFDYLFAVLFSGVRHDSGDPIAWGEKFIAHYEALGIDPNTKTLVFSDNLNFDRALDIAAHFQGRIGTSFGIGTFLTNDLGAWVTPAGDAFRPLNIVMKMTECNGMPVAKISDEPGKSMCDDSVYLANLKARFNVK
ncbi:nicotinate phosphoribosyltransferase [Marinobacter sp. X15-166B]|uniref:nicotinate phosphoribosyltransferase n=1 Tax=Marinobacter sp. X15-166B TaxID=1897620 RepID=UPI00085C13AF|nr:nicotinate phosphoribosyltransferase [Marinobacter sp. X15-166B]OEY67668.1 nicotinate phosphoribosyltransferase [Marinobacter sp. X15-166B]